MPDQSVAIGIDVGGTKALGVVVEPTGAVAAERRRDTPVGAAAIVGVLGDLVADLRADRPADDVVAVGVGIAGLVGLDGRLVRAPNLVEADGLALAAELAPRVGLPVVVDNDANCAARAELAVGAAVGADRVLLATLGTGIGGALVVGGTVERGAAGMAGEPGHMIVDPDGPPCPCGRRGCWERYASGAGLAHLAREAGLTLAGSASASDLRGEHVTRAARDGDPAARSVLDEFARWVALGLANVAAVTDPELVVVGGGLVEEWDLYGDGVRAAFTELLVAGDVRPPIPIEPARAGEHAGAIGAALLALTETV